MKPKPDATQQHQTDRIEAQSRADAEALRERLPVMPEPDGKAHANKERHPNGGYTYDEVDAWSEPMVRAYGQQCRDEALEEAAKVCRDMASVALSTTEAFALVNAAERIRALKETP